MTANFIPNVVIVVLVVSITAAFWLEPEEPAVCFGTGLQCSDDCKNVTYCPGDNKHPVSLRSCEPPMFCEYDSAGVPQCTGKTCKTEKPKCLEGDGGAIPSPTNCSVYYICAGGNPFEVPCNENKYYDSGESECVVGECSRDHVQCTKPGDFGQIDSTFCYYCDNYYYPQPMKCSFMPFVSTIKDAPGDPTTTTLESTTAESTTTPESTTAESTTTPESTTAESTSTPESTTVESTTTPESTTAASTITPESTTAESTITPESTTAESTTTPESTTAESTSTPESTTVESTTTPESTTAESTSTPESTTVESTTTPESTTAESTSTPESTTAESTTTPESTTAESTSTPESTTVESTTTPESTTAESTSTPESTTAESTTTPESTTAESTSTPESTTVESTTTSESTTVESTTTSESTTAESTSIPESTTTTTDAPMDCIAVGQKFPDPTDCRNYYYCSAIGATPVSVACRAGYHYSQEKYGCVPGGCDNTPPPTTDAPSTCIAVGQKSPDPEDCHSYLYCTAIGATPVSVACRAGYHYSQEKYGCVPGDCTNTLTTVAAGGVLFDEY